MQPTAGEPQRRVEPYEPPALVEIGALHELTQHGGKEHGGSDGHAFQLHPVVHASR